MHLETWCVWNSKSNFHYLTLNESHSICAATVLPIKYKLHNKDYTHFQCMLFFLHSWIYFPSIPGRCSSVIEIKIFLWNTSLLVHELSPLKLYFSHGLQYSVIKKKHGPHTPCLIILTKIMWEVSDVWACHKHTQSLCFSYRAFIFEACAKINFLWLAFYLLFHTVKSLLGHTVGTSVCQTGTFLNI